MKRTTALVIKWFANKLGYKIVMLKASNGTVDLQGNKELFRYLDTSGYLFKKEPLKRTYPKFIEPEPIKPLTPEQLEELEIKH